MMIPAQLTKTPRTKAAGTEEKMKRAERKQGQTKYWCRWPTVGRLGG